MCNEGMRLEGFRPIDQSDYLACCAVKGHKCWDASLPASNPHAEPPAAAVEDGSRHELLEDPTSVLDRKLADAVRGASYHEDAAGRSTASQAPPDMSEVKRLIDAGADADRCK